MNSYDVFDTIIGRKCYSPRKLFLQVEGKTGIPNFVERRLTAERYFQSKNQEYSLEDIYLQFGDINLAKIEFQTELENVFAIPRYANQIHPGDVLISDMYLSADQIRLLLNAAGVNFHGTILVSNYGKYKGEIWKQIKPSRHTGDNDHSDVRVPRQFGILTRKAHTDFMPFEKYIYRQQSPDFAAWLRYLRLKTIVIEADQLLEDIFIRYNIPLLYSMSILLKKYKDAKNVKKLLFMSRDTNLLMKMFNQMYPKDDSEYLYISREALGGSSKSYFQYLNSKLKKGTALVDMASSVGSLKRALPNIDIQNPKLFTGIYLIQPFNVDTKGIDLFPITNNKKTQINNTLLEMLNYALEDQVVDYKSGPVFKSYNEYDFEKVRKYHKIFDFALSELPEPENYNFNSFTIPAEDIFIKSLEYIQNSSGRLLKIFPNHIPVERRRKIILRRQIRKTGAIIVGSLSGYGWDRVRTWWKSIQLSDFEGEVHMLLYKDTGVGRYLKENGIIVHKHSLTHPQVVVSRFKDISDLCKRLPEDKFVIFTDVSDLIFQKNPNPFLDNVSEDIVVASEGIHFNGNEWVKNNLKKCFPEHYKEMAGKYLYNAGSIAVRAGVFVELALDIYNMCMKNPQHQNHDQAAMNILLQSKYKDRTLFVDVNGEWCFCAASNIVAKASDRKNYLGKPVTIKAGRLYNQDGTMPCMFHHYDRNITLKREVDRRVAQTFARR